MIEIRFVLVASLASMTIVNTSSPSVLIIGSGAAGIAAATRLLENNFTNIKILEAGSRIGGRIKSVKLGNSYVDLGARWCHGEDGNIVYNMVKDLNLLDSTPEIKTFFLSSKQEVEKGFGKEILDIILEIYDSSGFDFQEKHQNTGEVFQQRYGRIIQEKYANSPKKLNIAANAIDLLKLHVLSGEGAFSWFDPSPVSDFEISKGDFNLNWKGKGYKTILDVMMKKYPDPRRSLPIDDKFLFNKEVTRISWNTRSMGNNIVIRCSDDSTYTADHVIFTPSIGVLKEKANKLFVPKLPTEKLIAINEIGFGAVMKVIMYFSENWWGNSPGFLFVWTEEDKRSVIHEFADGPTWGDKSWLTFINMVLRADHNSNVLTVWFTGQLVPAIEFLPEELLIRGILFTFDKFLRHLYDIRRPDKILRSNWYADPHFRGTYSFQTVRSRLAYVGTSAQKILANPLRDIRGRPIVHFAGEATNPRHFSTVHGAIETGYREADSLLELYNQHRPE